MEPKHKLLATTAREDERHESESMKDRFTSLPDEVVHHILSSFSTRLDIKDQTLFSCVSKRCRQLVLSNPILCFDVFRCRTCKDRVKFINPLDRLLAHRGSNKLQLFIISWFPHCLGRGLSFAEDKRFRVLTWVQNVLVRCKVEALYLDMRYVSTANDDNLVVLPTCIFHAQSLRSLVIEFSCKIQVPSFALSSNIKLLELSSVTIVEEAFLKWISCCCNCIENLYLDYVYGPKSTMDDSGASNFLSVN